MKHRSVLRWTLLGVGAAAAATVALAVTAPRLFAADHRDFTPTGPGLAPEADINDLYVFMNPNDANEVIMSMSVFPFADTAMGGPAAFSDAVEYRFNVENELGTTFTVSCTFSAAATQVITCTGPGGETVTGNVGAELTSTSGRLRVQAGEFDDAFFFDLVGFQNIVNGATCDTLAMVCQGTMNTCLLDSDCNAFDNGDTFVGHNTLDIVVGADKTLFQG
ncbi:MAG TPA: DUF4331 family protein [Myxococcota bacterium]|jgi:hypothetical protein|nr:DUF4331 family protein [Myxococcota bacterium]